MNILQVKNTENFYREIRYKDSEDVAIDITGYLIHIELKDGKGNQVEDLSIGSGITVTDASSGLFVVDVADTSAWPIGTLDADILFVRPDARKVATETFGVKVIDGVTDG